MHISCICNLIPTVSRYLARKLFQKLLERKYHDTIIVPAASTLSRAWRCMVARRFVAAIRAERHHDLVVVPASVLIQRITRGRAARRVASTRRTQLGAALRMQKIVRGARGRRKVKAQRDFGSSKNSSRVFCL